MIILNSVLTYFALKGCYFFFFMFLIFLFDKQYNVFDISVMFPFNFFCQSLPSFVFRVKYLIWLVFFLEFCSLLRYMFLETSVVNC